MGLLVGGFCCKTCLQSFVDIQDVPRDLRGIKKRRITAMTSGGVCILWKSHLQASPLPLHPHGIAYHVPTTRSRCIFSLAAETCQYLVFVSYSSGRVKEFRM